MIWISPESDIWKAWDSSMWYFIYMPFLKGTVWPQLCKLQFLSVLYSEAEQCLKHPIPTCWYEGIEVYCDRLNGLNPELTENHHLNVMAKWSCLLSKQKSSGVSFFISRLPKAFIGTRNPVNYCCMVVNWGGKIKFKCQLSPVRFHPASTISAGKATLIHAWYPEQ